MCGRTEYGFLGSQVLNRMYNFTKWAVFVLKRASVWRPCWRTPTQTLLQESKSLQSKFMSKEVVVNECHACIDLCSVKECNLANELSSMHFQSSKQQDLWKCNITSNIDIVLNENKHGYLRIAIHLFISQKPICANPFSSFTHFSEESLRVSEPVGYFSWWKKIGGIGAWSFTS